mmetsp:Transcript_14548/g.35106  ORF Transcript_14548/g.35106 Transcript_14548/m.35106 type:complete len:96 (+) Transcript_14548:865-1152(+)
MVTGESTAAATADVIGILSTLTDAAIDIVISDHWGRPLLRLCSGSSSSLLATAAAAERSLIRRWRRRRRRVPLPSIIGGVHGMRNSEPDSPRRHP